MYSHQVEVKRLNEQVKRNIDRFLETFRFQLNSQEKDELVANCDRFESLKHATVNPYAFTELTLFTKRKKNVSVRIYTAGISNQFHLDLEKHNAQYPGIKAELFKKSHDRFLIIDDNELYHIGASLKDLGKKWFAFSRMDSLYKDVLSKIKTQKDGE